MKRTFSIFVFLVFLVPAGAGAATFDGGERYSLGADETVSDNLYVGGGDVTISGSIDGDAMIGGGSVTISGQTRDDLTLVGGDVTILGEVLGDVRTAGGNVVINAPVGGELVAGGGSVKALGNTNVGGDVVLGGGIVIFSGTAQGNGRFGGGQVIIDGRINGNVIADADEDIVLTENAQINGSLTYKGKNEDILTMQDGAVVSGEMIFKEQAPIASKGDVAKGLAAVFGLLFLGKVLATLIAAVLAVLVFKRFSVNVAQSAFDRWGINILRGFIVLIIVPIAAILLFATLIGAFVGAFVLLGYILLLMLAALYSGILFGSWVFKVITKSDVGVTWQHAVIGTVLLAIVQLIPIIGWIIGLAFFLMALGAVAGRVYEKMWLER